MKKSAMAYEMWGPQCGPGWNGLIDPLCKEVLRMGGTIRQIKEKFGALNFHYRLPSKVAAVPRGRSSDGLKKPWRPA